MFVPVAKPDKTAALKELKRKVRAAGGKLKPTPFAKRNGFGLPVLSSDDE